MAISDKVTSQITQILQQVIPHIEKEEKFKGISNYRAIVMDNDVYKDQNSIHIYYDIDSENIPDYPFSKRRMLTELLNRIIVELHTAHLTGMISEPVVVCPPLDFNTRHPFIITQYN